MTANNKPSAMAILMGCAMAVSFATLWHGVTTTEPSLKLVQTYHASNVSKVIDNTSITPSTRNYKSLEEASKRMPTEDEEQDESLKAEQLKFQNYGSSLRDNVSKVIDNTSITTSTGNYIERRAPPSQHAVDDFFLEQMEQQGLAASHKHQLKFLRAKDQFDSAYRNKKHLIYSAHTMHLFAFHLNLNWSYLHIFKNGGTTVEKQTHGKQKPRSDVGNRSLLATVRDPIDHFLSGWAECGEREFGRWGASNSSYDEQIQSWLKKTIRLSQRLGWGSCGWHSLPQANFMLTRNNRTIDPAIAVVGDLHELPSLLEMVGFHYDSSIASGRNASANNIKRQHFSNKKHLLSNNTLKDLCHFLELDYFLFDFEPPKACYDPESEVFGQLLE